MSRPEPSSELRRWLGDLTNTSPDDWWLVSKARHGMQLAMAALDPGEVITQPLTCLTAVNPILEAGHRAVYADVDAETLAISPASALLHRTSATRAIVGQHNFGPLAPIRELNSIFDDLVIIEDSAHCLGRVSHLATISVQSFGADKRLPTRQGGAIWINPRSKQVNFVDRLRRGLMTMPSHRFVDDMAFTMTRPMRKIASMFGSQSDAVMQAASALCLASPAVAPKELAGRNVGVPRQLDGAVLRSILPATRTFLESEDHRRRVCQFYVANIDHRLIPPGFRGDKALVRFPLVMPTPALADEVFLELELRGLVPGKWYRPLLFPGPSDPKAYGFDVEKTPMAADISARIVNLPTAHYATFEMAKEITDVIARHVR